MSSTGRAAPLDPDSPNCSLDLCAAGRGQGSCSGFTEVITGTAIIASQFASRDLLTTRSVKPSRNSSAAATRRSTQSASRP